MAIFTKNIQIFLPMDVQLVSLNNSNFDANSRNTVGYKIEKIINSALRERTILQLKT